MSDCFNHSLDAYERRFYGEEETTWERRHWNKNMIVKPEHTIAETSKATYFKFEHVNIWIAKSMYKIIDKEYIETKRFIIEKHTCSEQEYKQETED